MLFGGVERVGLGPVVAERSPLKTGSSVGPRLRGFGGFGHHPPPETGEGSLLHSVVIVQRRYDTKIDDVMNRTKECNYRCLPRGKDIDLFSSLRSLREL